MTAAIISALLAAACLLFLLHWRNRRLAGLPPGTLLAADDLAQDCPVLVSRRYGLKGKPDALVRTPEGTVIPIERKRARAPRRPYDSDLIQGIAYCILAEEVYGSAPPYVRIQYADRSFDEPYTPARKGWALQTSERLRRARSAGACDRSHRMAAKCRNCIQRQGCTQRL